MTISAKSSGGKGRAKKGFGSKTPMPSSRETANVRTDLQSKGGRPPPADDSEFVPRGPTMRANYVDRGLMEPELGPDSGILPQVVADRMIQRIAGFAGIPLAGLFAFFAGYFVAKYKYDITVIPAVVAYTTLGCIGASGFGITYGIMSSSWDEEKEGSKLGLKEFSMNILRARDGLTSMLAKERREDAEAASQGIENVNEWRKGQKERQGKD